MPMFSYIDEDDRLRGPFGDVQMHYWYLQAYLRPSLKIFVHYGLFGRPTTLGELMKKNGTSNPFYDGVANVRIEHTVCPKPTTPSTNTFHPFLTGYALEHVETPRLNEGNVEEYSAGFQFARSLYTLNYTNDVLKRFGANWKAECTLCSTTCCGIVMLIHCLSKPHIDKGVRSEMVDWEFSYLDAKGNFRGPFTAKEMRKWFGRGFFHADLEVFVHRGHLAEKATVGELCIINGEKTPFTFACLPVQPIIHRGFVEFPPGVTIKPKGAEAAESSSVTNSDVMPANSSAASQGDQKVATTHKSSSEKFVSEVRTSEAQRPDVSVKQEALQGETVKELNVTLAEAKKARSWPLLAPPDKKYPRTKKKIWIQQQFLDLRSQFRRADLTKFDKVKENQDLCGAVCKLCCVRLAAPSDVLRHLTVEDHQKKVENECQILGTEFDDYKKRLQVIVSSSTAASTKVSSTPSLAKPVTTKTITSSVAANSSKAGSAPTSSRTTNLSNVTSKGFVISTASKASAVPTGSVKTDQNPQKNPYLSIFSQAPSAAKEDLKSGDASFTKLMQPIGTTSSRALTDKEFATRMEELRALAVKIDTQKFVKIFKDRMSNNFCTLCSVRTDGPTTFLAHFVSQKHCSKMLTSGLPKATEDDFGLWKSQILAAVK